MKNTVTKMKLVGQHSPVRPTENTLIFDQTNNDMVVLRLSKMKSTKALFIMIAFFALLLVTSCNSSSEKVKIAEENVMEAKEDLSLAQDEFAKDVNLYRVEIGKKISSNEKAIADINAKIKKSNVKLRAEYEIQITALEKQNKDLNKKMNDYKADTKENWEMFKSQFNRDMDELGLALKNFTINN